MTEEYNLKKEQRDMKKRTQEFKAEHPKLVVKQNKQDDAALAAYRENGLEALKEFRANQK